MASELWGYKKAPRLPPTVVISSGAAHCSICCAPRRIIHGTSNSEVWSLCPTDDDDDDDPLDMLPASKRKRLLLARNTANTPVRPLLNLCQQRLPLPAFYDNLPW